MRRESCPAGGRCQIVRIKPARRSLLNRMWPVYGAAIQHAIGDRLNDEETGILVALLGKFYKSGYERLIILLSSWYDLYAHESLVQEWRAGSIFRVAAAYSTHPHQDRGDILGQHHCEGSSGRNRGIKKNDPQSIGQVAWRMEHQDSYGCRGCSNSHHFCAVARTGTRYARRARIAESARTTQPPFVLVDGPRLQKRGNTSSGA